MSHERRLSAYFPLVAFEHRFGASIATAYSNTVFNALMLNIWSSTIKIFFAFVGSYATAYPPIKPAKWLVTGTTLTLEAGAI